MTYIDPNHRRWDLRFLELAHFIAQWSKDPSTKTGAVIVDRRRRIVSVGYNGFPPGISDDERLNDRETKYQIIVHCERNAVVNASVNAQSLPGRTSREADSTRGRLALETAEKGRSPETASRSFRRAGARPAGAAWMRRSRALFSTPSSAAGRLCLWRRSWGEWGLGWNSSPIT